MAWINYSNRSIYVLCDNIGSMVCSLCYMIDGNYYSGMLMECWTPWYGCNPQPLNVVSDMHEFLKLHLINTTTKEICRIHLYQIMAPKFISVPSRRWRIISSMFEFQQQQQKIQSNKKNQCWTLSFVGMLF